MVPGLQGVRRHSRQDKVTYEKALLPFKESTLAKLRDTVQDIRDNLVPTLGVLQLEKFNGLEEETKSLTLSLASMNKGRSNFSLWRADAPAL